MSNVFHRSATHIPTTAVAGDGCYVVDADGKRYLDASGGAAVSCLGHSHPGVIAAIKSQLDALPYAHTGFFTSAPAEVVSLEPVHALLSGTASLIVEDVLALILLLKVNIPRRDFSRK